MQYGLWHPYTTRCCRGRQAREEATAHRPVRSVPLCTGAIHDGFHRVLAYDAQTGMVVLRVRDVAVLVDASNCVSAWTGWLRERLGTVSAVGYLERAPVRLPFMWIVFFTTDSLSVGEPACSCAARALCFP
jgi:hypothetical protein